MVIIYGRDIFLLLSLLLRRQINPKTPPIHPSIHPSLRLICCSAQGCGGWGVGREAGTAGRLVNPSQGEHTHTHTQKPTTAFTLTLSSKLVSNALNLKVFGLPRGNWRKLLRHGANTQTQSLLFFKNAHQRFLTLLFSICQMVDQVSFALLLNPK